MPDIIITPALKKLQFLEDQNDHTYVDVTSDGSGLKIINYDLNWKTRFEIEGVNGIIFSVNDDLSSSLMAVNDAAGLTVFEVLPDGGIITGVSNGYPAYLGSPTFSSGFAGSGWKIDQGITQAGKMTATFDNLVVRGQMYIYELILEQIRATNGSLFISSSAKTINVVFDGGNSNYIMDLDPEAINPFQYDDLIRAKRYSGTSSYDTWMRVVSITATQITASLDSGDIPLKGMDFVRVGNVSYSDRQGFIYLTSDDVNGPFIDIKDQITSVGAFSDTPKVRLGNLAGINDVDLGVLSGYGLFAQSAYLKGKIISTSGKIGNWSINPDSIQTGSYNTAGGMYLGSYGISLGDKFSVSSTGVLSATSGGFGGSSGSPVVSLTSAGMRLINSGTASPSLPNNIQIGNFNVINAATWTRPGSWIIVTLAKHGLQAGMVIKLTTVSDSAIPLGAHVVLDPVTTDTFKLPFGVGQASGTLSYVPSSSIQIAKTNDLNYSGIFGRDQNGRSVFALPLQGQANIAGWTFDANGIFGQVVDGVTVRSITMFSSTPEIILQHIAGEDGDPPGGYRISIGSPLDDSSIGFAFTRVTWEGDVTGIPFFAGVDEYGVHKAQIAGWNFNDSVLQSGGIYLTSNNLGGNASIGLGAATAFATGNGIWLDGAGNFRAGIPAGSKLEWDAAGTTLTVTGKVNINGASTFNGAISVTGSDITLAGGKIKSSATTTRVEMDSAGIKAYNAGTQRVQILSDGSGWLGTNTAFTWTNAGVVTFSGALSAASGSFAGSLSAATGSLGALTVGGVLTIGTGGSIASTNFNVTSAGALSATSASLTNGTFSGNITSTATITGGTIRTASVTDRISMSGTTLSFTTIGTNGGTASLMPVVVSDVYGVGISNAYLYSAYAAAANGWSFIGALSGALTFFNADVADSNNMCRIDITAKNGTPAANGIDFHKGTNAYSSLFIGADGSLNFGGGAAATDVKLYRSGADALKTDDALLVDGGLFVGDYSVTPPYEGGMFFCRNDAASSNETFIRMSRRNANTYYNGVQLRTQANWLTSGGTSGTTMFKITNHFGNIDYLVISASKNASATALVADSSTYVGPGGDGIMNLGMSTARWNTVYAITGTINTSDRRQKEQIEFSRLGLDFVEMLTPVSYKFKDKYDAHGALIQSFTKKYYGLIAQDVEDVLDGLGIDHDDFAGFVQEGDTYGLRYTEFIAPMIRAIQELSSRVKLLESFNEAF